MDTLPLENLKVPDHSGMFTAIPPKPKHLPLVAHFELVNHSNTDHNRVGFNPLWTLM